MIIEQLMKHCPEISITLTLDRPVHEQRPDDLAFVSYCQVKMAGR